MQFTAALTALFTASTLASPTQLAPRAGGKYLPDKEYDEAPNRKPVLGWCTMHIHEDWRTDAAEAFSGKSRKIEVHLFDAPKPEDDKPDPKLIFYQPQIETLAMRSDKLPYDGLSNPVYITTAAHGVGMDFHGFEISHGETTFNTDDKNHCDAGEIGTKNNRKERDYDCGFSC